MHICIFFIKSEEVFANLSNKFTIEGLAFYSVNVELNENICKRHEVEISGIIVELPIVIFFKNGQEVKRYPTRDNKGNTYQAQFYIKKELIKFFDLENIFQELSCKL